MSPLSISAQVQGLSAGGAARAGRDVHQGAGQQRLVDLVRQHAAAQRARAAVVQPGAALQAEGVPRRQGQPADRLRHRAAGTLSIQCCREIHFSDVKFHNRAVRSSFDRF